MKSLYESILSSTGTGKFAYKKQIEKGEFTPELVKMLENEVAYYKPHDRDELKKLIEQYIKAAGNNCSLNWIDTSGVTDMSDLFAFSTTRLFNGDISKWNVSKVTTMSRMFYKSDFNGNISDWDVSNVKNMFCVFYFSDFNGNISDWDVSNVTNMSGMFRESHFNGNISKWNVSNVVDMSGMFYESDFNGNISDWDVSNVIYMYGMFLKSSFNGDISKWDVKNVRNMNGMFKGSKKFNQDISKWNVKNVSAHIDAFTNCPIKENYKPDFR